jgi:hypothetical protein
VKSPADREADRPPLPLRAAFAGGLVSILVQSVALRESLFGQHLSELSSGLVLAAWLAASGLGAALQGRLPGARTSWVLCMVLLPAAGFAQVVLSRTSLLHPALACIPAGFAAGVIFLAPFAGRPPGRVYSAEAIGAAAGGALFVLLSPRLLAPGMLLAASAASAAGLLWSAFSRTGLIMALLVSAGLLTGADDLASRWMGEASFGGIGEFTLHSSPYGEIARVSRSGQTSIYRNGLLDASWPAVESAESAVTVPLLAALPERVIYIGTSPEEAGLIAAWPGVLSVISLVPDPVLLDLAGYPEGARRGDGRSIAGRTGEGTADLVIVSESAPLSLLSNRYFTREFFAAVAGSLNPGGMLAVRLPGGQNRLHPIEARLAQSVRRAADEVFDWTVVLPSGGLTLLAGNGEAPPLDGEVLAGRMDSIGAVGTAVCAGTLPFDISQMRMESLEQQLGSVDPGVNSDLHPEAFAAAQELWDARSGVEGFDPVPAAVILLAAVVVAASMLSGRPAAAFALASAGAAGLAVEMLAIVIIQASTGLSWMLVGAVTGTFMCGAAGGSLLQVKGPVRSFRPILLVSASGSGTAALAVLLYDGGVIGGGMLSTAMILAVLLTGISSGAAFPVAAGLLGTGDGRMIRLGLLDLAEHGAGAAAAMAVPLLLFPVMGAAAPLALTLICSLLAACFIR